MDTRTISPEVSTNAIPEGVDVILASPSMMSQHLLGSQRGTTPPGLSSLHRLVCLIQYLAEAHSGEAGGSVIGDTTELRPQAPHIASLFGTGSLIDAHKFCSMHIETPESDRT
jgi:hypothetical protein